MHKKLLYSALLSTFACSAQAALSVEGMTFTGGSLTITDQSDNALIPTLTLTAGASASVNDGILNGVIDADGLHGSVSNPVVSTELMGYLVTGYFAHSGEVCNLDCSSMITVYDPDPDAISMSGTPWDPVISADFSGFFAEFNGNEMLQGGIATGTGSWIVIPTAEGSPGSFSFDLSWSALVAEGPFQGMKGHWNVNGTAVVAVPEPEAYALMLAGLGLVGTAARIRRKAAAA